jgi:hypothetical protein
MLKMLLAGAYTGGLEMRRAATQNGGLDTRFKLLGPKEQK